MGPSRFPLKQVSPAVSGPVPRLPEAEFCLVHGDWTVLECDHSWSHIHVQLCSETAAFAFRLCRFCFKTEFGTQLIFQMHSIRRSVDGDKDEMARESHHCLLSIMHLFPRGKLCFLILNIHCCFPHMNRKCCPSFKEPAALMGGVRTSPDPDTCFVPGLSFVSV